MRSTSHAPGLLTKTAVRLTMVGATAMLAVIVLSHSQCLFAEVFTDSFKLEMEKLVDAKEFGRYQQRMCEVADGVIPGVSFRERVFSVHFMFEALGHRVPVDLDVVEKSIERIIEDSDNPALVSDVGDQLVFEAHHLRIRLLTARGQFLRAAEESEELTIRWERKLGRLMNSSQYLPKLWCQAGQPNRARQYIDRVTSEFPNSYPANAAVRVKFAQYLNDTDNPSEAFLLLHELRESFPIEFAADVFAVQNYVDYASQLPLKAGDLANQETMLDVQKFVDEAELENDFTRVKATLAYGRAKIEKRLGNDDKAKGFFELAKLNANTDNFGKTLVAWSDQEIKHMEVVKQQKLESKANFKSVHDVSPEPPSPTHMNNNSRIRFLIIVNGSLVIALIVLFVSRKAK